MACPSVSAPGEKAKNASQQRRWRERGKQLCQAEQTELEEVRQTRHNRHPNSSTAVPQQTSASSPLPLVLVER